MLPAMEVIDASTLAAAVLGHFAAGPTHAARPFVLGLSGVQGSGKSTLAAAIVDQARAQGWPAVALSLDDVYLTRMQRETLAKDVHPLLRTRGVPGTHDLNLLDATLDALAHASATHPVALPRFDKGQDDRAPVETWPSVRVPPRLVVLEGWCLGAKPAAAETLIEPINALERDEDPDGTWRRWVNTRLADYLPLWKRLDALVVLRAPSWDVVARWREQAEQPLRERGEPRAMNAPSLARFLQHYERISRRLLTTWDSEADWVIALDEHRHATLPSTTPRSGAK
ncbi:D-glycerate 3-kinase [Luteibacter sp. UNCMF366Tsu5.1]|nr:D-glycerate 3-kinase [Luteibacter sp. UNCMF366Tsu5.1]